MTWRRAGQACPAPSLAVPLVLIGAWPVWRWYGARMVDGSDEPLGLLAVVAALALAPRRGWHAPLPLQQAGLVLALTAGALAGAKLPPLVRAAIAVLALGCALPRQPSRPLLPVVTLLLLSLPVMASLQFYLGFPLRAVVTQCCAALLGLGGLTVEARGTVLRWAGEEVLVDAPCSGIHMLWTTCFASAVLGAVHHLPPRRFVRLLHVSAASAFAANTARCLALFLLETGMLPRSAWAHEWVGLLVFAPALLVSAACAHRWRHPVGPAAAVAAPAASSTAWHRLAALPLLAGAAVALAAAAWGTKEGWREATVHPPPALAGPDMFEGRPLKLVPLHPRDERFASGFPGSIAAFDDGERRLVVRRVFRPTRKLHPASDCLRAAGCAVRPLPAFRDREGALWGALEATARGGGHRLRVRERITGSDGRGFTDVSAWFWAALGAPEAGPWTAVTVYEPLPEP